jgi:hypothetical protein
MAQGFVDALTAAPPLSKLSRYIVANGVFYMLAGLVLFLAPADWVALALLLDGFEGYEEGWARMVGVSLFVVGWFYVMGGRTGATSFGLATVVDRALVPFVMFGLYATGKVAAGMVLGVAVIDPLLAIGAFLIWRSERGDYSGEATPV